MNALIPPVLRTLSSRIPPHIRAELNVFKRIINIAESRIRRKLPIALGGAFGEKQLFFRPLNPQDIDAYLALYGHAPNTQSKESLHANLAMTSRFCIGCFWQGTLVAAGWCFPQWKHLEIDGLWMVSAYVHPSVRKRGIGKLLHLARIQEAKKRGHRDIFGLVAEHNIPARRALLALDFVHIHNHEWLERIHTYHKEIDAPSKSWLIYKKDL